MGARTATGTLKWGWAVARWGWIVCSLVQWVENEAPECTVVMPMPRLALPCAARPSRPGDHEHRRGASRPFARFGTADVSSSVWPAAGGRVPCGAAVARARRRVACRAVVACGAASMVRHPPPAGSRRGSVPLVFCGPDTGQGARARGAGGSAAVVVTHWYACGVLLVCLYCVLFRASTMLARDCARHVRNRHVEEHPGLVTGNQASGHTDSDNRVVKAHELQAPKAAARPPRENVTHPPSCNSQ